MFSHRYFPAKRSMLTNKLNYKIKFSFHTQTHASVINAKIIRSFVVVWSDIELKPFSFNDDGDESGDELHSLIYINILLY